MKLSFRAAVWVASAACGFGLVCLLPGNSKTTQDDSGNFRPPRIPSSLSSPVKMDETSQEAQQYLALRFRTALDRLGIPGSWAEELAALQASGFPALLERMKVLPARHREHLRELLFGR